MSLLYQGNGTTIETLEGKSGGVVVKFSGTIDHANPGEFLDPILDMLHSQILEKKLLKVDADFTSLTFLNSSGIKSLIKWIMKQVELPKDRRYPINLVYSNKITWQRTSLRAIMYLAKDIVTAEAAPLV
jgi:hypothetical protein